MTVTLGNTSPSYTVWNDTYANEKRAGRFLCSVSGYQITGFKLYCGCSSAGLDCWKGIVYSDSGGNPVTLLGASNQATISAGSSKLWRYIACATPIPVTKNLYYWIGFIDRYGRIQYGRAPGGTGVYNADTYSDGPAATFGAHTAFANPAYLTIYAILEPVDSAPYAPVITSPATGASIVAAQTNRFMWTFSSPVAGDTQSAFDFYWAPTGSNDWNEAPRVSRLTQYDLPAGMLTAGVSWDIYLVAYGALGLPSPVSAKIIVAATVGTGGPDITYFNADAAVVDYVVTVDSVVVTYSIVGQITSQVRRLADAAGSPNTAVVYETVTVPTTTGRTATLTFDTNHCIQHVQARTEYPAGVWSAWATCRVSVEKAAPAVPIIDVVAVSAGGYISVTVTHPTPTGAQPAVVSMDIFRDNVDGSGAVLKRIAADLAPTAVYLDYSVAGGIDYTYVVRAKAASGTSSDSE